MLIFLYHIGRFVGIVRILGMEGKERFESWYTVCGEKRLCVSFGESHAPGPITISESDAAGAGHAHRYRISRSAETLAEEQFSRLRIRPTMSKGARSSQVRDSQALGLPFCCTATRKVAPPTSKAASHGVA